MQPDEYPNSHRNEPIKRNGYFIDSTLFKSVVGSLRYLAITSPDIIYGVRLVNRTMETPKESHWLAARRILRYIKDTLNLGLFYTYGETAELVGYSDSDWGGDQDERKSTTMSSILGQLHFHGP